MKNLKNIMKKEARVLVSLIFLILLVLPFVSATEYWNSAGANLSIADKLFVNYNNGNVGVGTTTPGAKLEVAGGDIVIPNNQFYRMKNTVAANTNGIGLDAANNMILFTDYGTKVTIQPQGNVGVGTTTPAALLHIQGNTPELFVNATSGSADVYVQAATNNYGYLSLRSGTSNQYDVAIKSNEYSGALQFRPSGGAPTVVFQTGGNVGIGTTNPATTLQVAGRVIIGSQPDVANLKLGVDAGGSTAIAMQVTNDYANPTSAIRGGEINFYPAKNGGATPGSFIRTSYWGAASEGRLSLETYGRTNQLVLNEGGNVGIGLTSPAQTLSINGTFSVTGQDLGAPALTIVTTNAGGSVISSTDGAVKFGSNNIVNSGYVYTNQLIKQSTLVNFFDPGCSANNYVTDISSAGALGCSRPVPASDTTWTSHNNYPSAITSGSGSIMTGIGDTLTSIKSGFDASNTAGTGCANNAVCHVNFNFQQQDLTDTEFDSSTGNFTVGTAGYYYCFVQGTLATNLTAGKVFCMSLRVNAAEVSTGCEEVGAQLTNPSVNAHRFQILSTGDKVDVDMWHNMGIGAATGSGNGMHFGCIRIGT